MSEKETGNRTYELGYLLVPTTAETEVAKATDALAAAITTVEGEILASGDPEYIDLAYQMEKSIGSKKMKYSQGYFGWMKFTSAPEALEALKKNLDSNADLIRYILIKTTVENNIVFKKPKVEAKRDMGIPEELLEETDEMLDDSDLKEDHELLPDLASDIAPVETIGEEKEEL